MSKRTKELVTGVSAVVALAAGVTACGGSNKAEHKLSAEAAQNARGLQQVAGRMIELAAKSPTRYEGKPPYTITFTETTTAGGTISFTLQTATPKHNTGQAQMVEVQQTGSNEPNFDLSLDAKTDGTWNMYCNTNAFSSGGRKLAVLGEKSIQLNGKTFDKQAIDAEAMLTDEVTKLNNLLDTAAQHQAGNMPASPNVCDINLG